MYGRTKLVCDSTIMSLAIRGVPEVNGTKFYKLYRGSEFTKYYGQIQNNVILHISKVIRCLFSRNKKLQGI